MNEEMNMSPELPVILEEATDTNVTQGNLADTPVEEVTEEVTEEIVPQMPPEELTPEELTPEEESVNVESLREELANLREELAKTRALHARMDGELAEFCNLFPEISPTSLPDSIWEEVKRGIPLAASYALYEKKCVAEKARAEEINLQNAQKSPGAAGKDTAAEYFTPDDVRAMSRAEVHYHYQKIMDSMKKWNS